MRWSVMRRNEVPSSKFKVTLGDSRSNWSTHFVQSISSTLMDGFQINLTQMFTSVRRSVMRKNRVPCSNVKVTLWNYIKVKLKQTICPKHFSYTHGGILIIFHTNVQHYERECHTQEPSPWVKVKVTLRYLNKSTHFVRSVSPTCIEIF